MQLRKAMMISLLLSASGLANADAIISDGNVAIGVTDYGSLNVGGGNADVTGLVGTGLRYINSNGTEFEATYHGCECEGWGIAAGDGSFSSSANEDDGNVRLNVNSFTSDATSATSNVSTFSGVDVTHAFALAAETDNLFRVTVTIENNSGADIDNLLYRRTFDWDTSPTPFDEYVTIQGALAATAVTSSTDDGFCSSDPLSACGSIVTGGTGDFVALGPEDHGASFDFDFGLLAQGDSYTFDIFYGGAANRTDALNALGSVGAEVYSLGWSGFDTDQDGFHDTTDVETPTFIFGFSGVGGVALPNPGGQIPEPGTLALFGLSLVGLLRFGQRK